MERVKTEIEELIQRLEVEGVEASYEITFELDGKVVSHVRGKPHEDVPILSKRAVLQIVGKGGAGINKLREELGVRVDFSDLDQASTPQPSVTKKRVPKPKATVTIKGRKANVEEAKKRILSQADKVVSCQRRLFA